MFEAVADLIQGLPPGWRLIAWIAIIFITWAAIAGIIAFCKLLIEVVFEGIAVGSMWLLLWISKTIWMALTYPFRMASKAWHLYRMRRAGREAARRQERNKSERGKNIVEVHTPYLNMKFDQRTGSMSGEILQGPHLGRELSSLDLKSVLEFFSYSARDHDTKQLMQSYLDQTFGTIWRRIEGTENQRKAKAEPKGSDITINYSRAVEIFDLQGSEDFTLIDLKKRYRSVIRNVHPDKGGSNFFAKQANEALKVIKKRKGW